jgi:hypothetical protein
MRGQSPSQSSMLCLVSPEAVVPTRRTQFVAHLVGAAYNLLRVARLRLPAAT